MKKLLLVLVCALNGAALYASKDDEGIDLSDYDVVETEDATPKNVKEYAGVAARDAWAKAKQKSKDELEKAVNKQIDTASAGANEWLEKELPGAIDRAVSGIAEKTKSGASSLWGSAKKKVSGLWDRWFGSSKKEAKPALINQIPVNALMEDLD